MCGERLNVILSKYSGIAHIAQSGKKFDFNHSSQLHPKSATGSGANFLSPVFVKRTSTQQ